jgi:hypothetical protein
LEQKNLQLNFRNERTQSTPFDPKLMFVAFFGVSVFDRTNVRNSLGRPVIAYFWNKKLAVEFSRNERTQSTPFDPKLMFVAFSEFRFRRKNGAKLAGRSVFATFGTKNLQLNFPQRNAPNPPV